MDIKNWMKNVDGGKLISELTIPGTHDSATYKKGDSSGGGYVKTQTLSIEEQLGAGCRFLDIRLKVSRDHLSAFHGPFHLDLFFGAILNFLKTFLSQNPTETILMSIKNEDGFDSDAAHFEQVFITEYLNPNAQLWYTKNRIPQLREVRGKIVLLRRFKKLIGYMDLGIDFDLGDNKSGTYRFSNDTPAQTLFYEDKYNVGNSGEKKDAIARNISNAEKSRDVDNLFLTFASGYVTKLGIPGSPRALSEHINPWLLDSLKIDRSNKGIVVCDFIDNRLAELLVQNNSSERGGYVLMDEKGRVRTFGDAIRLDDGVGNDGSAVAIAGTPSGRGYRILSPNGGIHDYGANYLGHGTDKYSPAVDFAVTPSGQGLWVLSENGGIHNFGDAGYHKHGVGGDRTAVAIAASPSGKGYWILSPNGGIHGFGDVEKAYFGRRAVSDNSAVDIAATKSGNGYWILLRNGSIHAFGDAPHLGDGIGGYRATAAPSHAAVALARTPEGDGYYIFCDDGTVFNFGKARFLGQPQYRMVWGQALENPIVDGAWQC